jgi:hypothetical protein
VEQFVQPGDGIPVFHDNADDRDPALHLNPSRSIPKRSVRVDCTSHPAKKQGKYRHPIFLRNNSDVIEGE